MAPPYKKNYTLSDTQERQLQRWYTELNAVGVAAGVAGITAAYYGLTSGPKGFRVFTMFLGLIGAAWRAKRFLPPFKKKFQEKDPEKWRWVVEEKLAWWVIMKKAPIYPLSFFTFVAGLYANDTLLRSFFDMHE